MDEILSMIALVGGVILFSLIASIANMLRISSLKDEVQHLRSQINALTLSAGAPQPVVEEIPEALRDEVEDQINRPEAQPRPIAATSHATPAEDVTETVQQDTDSMESRIGGRWAVWLGGLTLALGGLFLVKYSIESGLLSPEVRLSLTALFAIALVLGGEYLRRRGGISIEAMPKTVSIPGLLTAAGAVTLFGTIYVAHDFYQFFGESTTFALLALTSLATLAMSSLHGQSIAVLGLIGAMVAPLLISSKDPSATALFAYLAITGAASLYASKAPRWTFVPALAFVGLGIWSLFYLFVGDIIDPLPVAGAFLALLAAAIFLWPANQFTPDAQVPDDEGTPFGNRILGLITRAPFALSATISSVCVAVPLIYLDSGETFSSSPYYFAVVVIAALAALGASRSFAVLPTLFAAGGALVSAVVNSTELYSLSGVERYFVNSGTNIPLTLALSAVFVLCALSFFKRRGDHDQGFAPIWAVIAALIPVWLAAISFANFGVYQFDLTHFLFGLALGVSALLIAEYFSRSAGSSAYLALNGFVTLSFLAFAFALHTISAALTTTLLIPLLGFAYVMAARIHSWRALEWMMVPALLITMGRFGWEPTIVGPDRLSTVPLFNPLLPAYGLPAVLAIVTAWHLRASTDLRLKNIMQALASILSLLAIAVLVRHAMNGGTLTSTIPSLGEQSIYSLLLVGLSLVMLFLDRKDGSLTLRYGSMLASAISVVLVLYLHLVTLNPYFTGELTGRWPIVNLLLVGYLMPALAYATLAYFAKGNRPKAYLRAISAASALMAFVWITLEVRHFWHGSSIADWKGFLQSETYSYTLVWLLLGVALLVMGIMRDAMVLRFASAALLVLAIAKAFLIDMSNLEGALRALSFIGLGIVLMGIGLFYQKVLSKPRTEKKAQA